MESGFPEERERMNGLSERIGLELNERLWESSLRWGRRLGRFVNKVRLNDLIMKLGV